MKLRIPAVVLVIAVGSLCFAKPNDGLEKQTHALKSLFEGLPKDLRAKVKENPVRCDRVNDWLVDQVNGKGKTIEFVVGVKRVRPYRLDDVTYRVELTLDHPTLRILEDDWRIHFCDHFNSEDAVWKQDFHFRGVSMADAEKLADAKQVALRAKVQLVRLSRFAYADTPHTIHIVLEDVQVDGKKWERGLVPKDPGAVFKKGKGGFGGDNVKDKAKKDKGK